jgi:hypothetical protein
METAQARIDVLEKSGDIAVAHYRWDRLNAGGQVRAGWARLDFLSYHCVMTMGRDGAEQKNPQNKDFENNSPDNNPRK